MLEIGARLLTCIYVSKGAKVTRSTSAYALPLFLPRPENSKQKAPVQGKNNPEIPFPARSDLPLFGTDGALEYYEIIPL